MKKRNMPPVMILGVCLVLISLCLFLGFQIRQEVGVRQCRRILSDIEAVLPDETAGVPGLQTNPGMPMLEMEGTDYVAILDIPSFGLTLPVADLWDSNRLFRSPARFYGSAYDNTLILGGADDPRQFGFCDKIQPDAQVTVTDMTGARFTYTVSRVERAKHAETAWLMDTGGALTLFCHDSYTMEYIAVRCDFAYE